MASLSENQYKIPILDLWEEIKHTEWCAPFLPQVLKVIVIGVILLLLSVMYLTIGEISQLSGLLLNLMSETGKNIKSDSFINASAYAITYAVYLVLFIPLWIIQAPFLLLGCVYHKSKLLYILLLMLIVIIGLVLMKVIIIDFNEWGIQMIRFFKRFSINFK